MKLLEKVNVSLAKFEDFDDIRLLLNEITQTISSKAGWKNYRVNANADQQKEIFRQIIDGGNKIFIARHNNLIVGIINMQVILNLRHGWKRAHLEEVVVREGHRHKGIGSFMLQNIMEYCNKNKIKVIKLLCGSQLPIAQKFYEKNGFVFKDKGYRLEL